LLAARTECSPYLSTSTRVGQHALAGAAEGGIVLPSLFPLIYRGKSGKQYFLKKLLRGTWRLLYSALRFPKTGGEQYNKTINRQLFFVWLDNAFVSD
jgi:hypothetical protein